MSKHDELLQQGPRQAPEPETAEQRSNRVGWGGAAGGVAAGGVALAKFGALGKFFLWIIAWHGALDLWRIGGWIALALVAAVLAIYLVVRARKGERLS